MSDAALFVAIWAAVGASGLSVGSLGVAMTRRRLRSLASPKTLDRPSQELQPAA